MLYFFALAVKFYKSSLLGCPPVLHHAPVRTFCVSFWSVTYIFLTKTGLLDAPQGGCPGSSHRPHPLCTPLEEAYSDCVTLLHTVPLQFIKCSYLKSCSLARIAFSH